MKQYHVKVSIDAQNDLRRLLSHLLYEIKSSQAFDNVLDDFEETLVVLKTAAGIHAASENAELVKRGLRRINLRRHNYFMLYYVDGNTAYVTNVFHGMEDYENKLR